MGIGDIVRMAAAGALVAGSMAVASPAHAADYNSLARQAQQLNDSLNCEEALTILRPHSNKSDNRSSYFFNQLGISYKLCNQPSEAERMYQKALSLNPNSTDIRNNLAWLYIQQGSRQRASEQIVWVLKRDPNNKYAKHMAGMLGTP